MSDDGKRLTTDDFDPRVMRLFDQYVHGQIDRRGFLVRRRHASRSAPRPRPACWPR